MTKGVKNPLSTEFKVACEIYKFESQGTPVSFSKLVVGLDGKLSMAVIKTAIDTLFDWGVIRAEFGFDDLKRKVRLLQISNEHKNRIKDLYENYWKTENFDDIGGSL